MAVRQRSQSDETDDSRTVDLKDDLGLNLPPTEVAVDLTGNRGGWVLDVTRSHKWTVEGSNAWGEVTSVYDEDGNTVPLPERVPAWLLRVCQLYGVDELAI